MAAVIQGMGVWSFTLVVVITFQNEYRTRSTDSIEEDIWEAGGEPDALILGISFDTGKQILLNTLHIARLDKQMSSELDNGLFITTYPVPVL